MVELEKSFPSTSHGGAARPFNLPLVQLLGYVFKISQVIDIYRPFLVNLLNLILGRNHIYFLKKSIIVFSFKNYIYFLTFYIR